MTVTVVEARSPCTRWEVLVVVTVPDSIPLRRAVGTLSVQAGHRYGIAEHDGGAPARFRSPVEAQWACARLVQQWERWSVANRPRHRRWRRRPPASPERMTFVVTPADRAPGTWPGWLHAGALVSP